MLSLLIPVLVSSALPTLPETYRMCSLHRLDRCRNTSFLVMNSGFQQAVKAFSGHGRTRFVSGVNKPLWKEIIESLHGPPDAPVILPDGNYLFTACQAHFCLDKGAVVVSPKGEIVSAAMFTGSPVDWDKPSAPYHLALDIFVRDGRIPQSWRRPIDRWAALAAIEWRAYLQDMKWSTAGTDTTTWLISPTGKL